jgi:hypothetical protein
MVLLPQKRTFEQARKVYELAAKSRKRDVVLVHVLFSYKTKGGTWILRDSLETIARVSRDGIVTIVAPDISANK